MSKAIEFTATIIQHQNMNAGYIEFPYSTFDLFGKKGQVKIKAVFDDQVEYRGSLSKMGQAHHILIITQEFRKKLNKSFGDELKVNISEDLDERVVEIPEDVVLHLRNNPEAYQILQSMSYTHQKEYIRWITEAKKPETRERRKQKMIEMILAGKKGG